MRNRLDIWVAVAMVAPVLLAEETNWPQFRGPRGDGSTVSNDLPLRWSETEGVAWKTSIHGRAWSSPVVWGRQIWLTTATEDGRELFALSADLATGRVEFDLRLFTIEQPQFAHRFNTYASPTPAVEEGRVYVTFGSPGTACLDTTTGEVLWERTDFVCNHFRGAGSSPILYDNLLILNFDGSDHQYVVALDKRTGATRWRRERSIDFRDLGADGKPELEGDLRKAFATGHVAELDGIRLLLSQGSQALYAYEPLTGEEIWRVEDRTAHSGGTRPAVGHGLVFFPSGWPRGQVLAVRPGRKGEVIDANEPAVSGVKLGVAWKTARSVPKKPSLTLAGDWLFGIDDGGIATCWDAATGRVRWNERIGGNYSASPLAAPGRVYLFSEEGRSTVVRAAAEFEVLAENQLGDGFMASPAVAGRSLILRSRTCLYRVGN